MRFTPSFMKKTLNIPPFLKFFDTFIIGIHFLISPRNFTFYPQEIIFLCSNLTSHFGTKMSYTAVKLNLSFIKRVPRGGGLKNSKFMANS